MTIAIASQDHLSHTKLAECLSKMQHPLDKIETSKPETLQNLERLKTEVDDFERMLQTSIMVSVSRKDAKVEDHREALSLLKTNFESIIKDCQMWLLK